MTPHSLETWVPTLCAALTLSWSQGVECGALILLIIENHGMKGIWPKFINIPIPNIIGNLLTSAFQRYRTKGSQCQTSPRGKKASTLQEKITLQRFLQSD